MNETFSLRHLEVELKKHRPTALFVTHGDSSTGTVQNLNGLGDICHRWVIYNLKTSPTYLTKRLA